MILLFVGLVSRTPQVHKRKNKQKNPPGVHFTFVAVILNTIFGNVCLIAFILLNTCEPILFQPFLFDLPLSVLTPLHSDGEVLQEVAEHTFLTESLFKLNLNDPLST